MDRSQQYFTGGSNGPSPIQFDGGRAAFEASPNPISLVQPSQSVTGTPIPRNPTPIVGGSFIATGAGLGSMTPLGPGLGTVAGAGVGLLMDGALLWWQKSEQDKAARKQLREARRLNAIQAEQDRKDRLEQRRQFELNYGLQAEGQQFNQDQVLRSERVAKLQRLKQSIVDRIATKAQIQDRFVQKGYI